MREKALQKIYSNIKKFETNNRERRQKRKANASTIRLQKLDTNLWGLCLKNVLALSSIILTKVHIENSNNTQPNCNETR